LGNKQHAQCFACRFGHIRPPIKKSAKAKPQAPPRTPACRNRKHEHATRLFDAAVKNTKGLHGKPRRYPNGRRVIRAGPARAAEAKKPRLPEISRTREKNFYAGQTNFWQNF
jgi:hypothetical protein